MIGAGLWRHEKVLVSDGSGFQHQKQGVTLDFWCFLPHVDDAPCHWTYRPLFMQTYQPSCLI